ncbi:MAG TPA: 3-oxoacyl-[acyl-carrier-protein] synthase III C-terminal domain-containing protein [Stellaceae bacterium]|nr:3-oxoacyl-[acyl-carrier-protein] synthase III C-terminal domain-containing protein [Stellaceae bacterium]
MDSSGLLAVEPMQRMRIAGIASALPKHRYGQHAITEALKGLWRNRLENPELLDRLHSRTGVDSRHLAFPLQRYAEFSSWGETNAAWLEVAGELGVAAIDGALRNAGMQRHDLDALFVVSITGIASPSLDARLINRLGLRPDIKRTPIFGVGCAGGAIGLSRAADYARGYPRHCAAILAVEACSLTLQRDDLSTANLISTGLFGDGAAAVIVAGEQRAGDLVSEEQHPSAHSRPRILGSGSVFYPDSEDVMGWEISQQGLRIVLSPRLPDVIEENLAGDVDAFLDRYGLCRADIGSWVIHTGGPKVLRAIQDSLDLRDRDLDRSWDCLSRFGNLSSASVLLVLEDVVANHPPPPGTYGLLLAMGPGFCSEMVLLQW